MKFEGRGEILRERGASASLVWLLLMLFQPLRHFWFRGEYHPVSMAFLAAFALTVIFAATVSIRGLLTAVYPGSAVLSADGAGVFVGGKLAIPRRSVRSAYLPSLRDPVVRIERRWNTPVTLRLATVADARAFVESLDFGIERAPLRLQGSRGNASLARTFALNVLFLLGLGITFDARVPAGFALLALAVVARWAWFSCAVVVGMDGLLLGPFYARRFIPHDAIAGATVEGRAVVLALRSGERLRFTPRGVPAAALVEHIEAARALATARTGTSGSSALLVPAGRTLKSWVADLRALGSSDGYRTTPVDAGELRRVLDDPGAPAEARAGAAAALKEHRDEDTRARVEIVARASANPKLRVALSRIADGEGDEVERALEPLARGSLAGPSSGS